MTTFLKRIHWVNFLFLTSTCLGALILTPLYFSGEWHWGALALFVVYSAVTSISITGGYHRLFSHRSYDAKPWVRLGYLLFGAAAFQGSCLQWSKDHRRHHRFVDTQDDPHNIRKGFFWAHVGWLLLKADPPQQDPSPQDLVRDKLVVWQDRYYVPVAGIMGFGFPALVGWAMGDVWGGLLLGGIARVFTTNHCTFFINSLAHTWGRQTYSEQTARDSVLMAVLGYGEGYHNYHHQFAADYRNGIRWYHWDPTKWLIKLMSLMGWTYRLKVIPATEILKARLQAEQQLLLRRGFPEDRVALLKQRVEEAQKKWRTLCEDYRQLKRNMRHQSSLHLAQLKGELKAARRDFNRAWEQWRGYKSRPVAAALA